MRRARRAEIVVANHALVMIQAALGGGDDASLPTRYVFDEGHHVFDAADSAFSANLSGIETAELRRWLIGAEGRRSWRRRRAAGTPLRSDAPRLATGQEALHRRRLGTSRWIARTRPARSHSEWSAPSPPRPSPGGAGSCRFGDERQARLQCSEGP